MYDPECQTLAEHFLSDEWQSRTAQRHDERVKALAQAIQDAVEAWTADNESIPIAASGSAPQEDGK